MSFHTSQALLVLSDLKVYVLPDNYEVHDPSLDDISAVLAPAFTKTQVAELRSPSHIHKLSYDLSSRPYLPGFVGLNNIKRNDYLNVVIHSLAHIAPLRDFFLLFKPVKPAATATPTVPVNGAGAKVKAPPARSSELLNRFATLVKKLWNPRLFKSQVSPHDFLQEVVRASGGKFKITEQGDPVEFLGWLLHHLHMDLGGSKKRNSSKQRRRIIARVLGLIMYLVLQVSLYRHSKATFGWNPNRSSPKQIGRAINEQNSESTKVSPRPSPLTSAARSRILILSELKVQRSPFLFLSVDLPPPPLFQDAVERNIIPQVSLASVLAKYDGKTVQVRCYELVLSASFG